MLRRLMLICGLLVAVAGCGKPAPTPVAEPVLPPAGPELAPVTVVDHVLRDKASIQCDFFEKQCKAYYVRNSQLPNSLQDLVAPQDGSRPLVNGGKSALNDPWGGLYTLVDAKGLNPITGQLEFHVMCYQNGDKSQPIYSPTRTKSMKK